MSRARLRRSSSLRIPLRDVRGTPSFCCSGTHRAAEQVPQDRAFPRANRHNASGWAALRLRPPPLLPREEQVPRALQLSHGHCAAQRHRNAGLILGMKVFPCRPAASQETWTRTHFQARLPEYIAHEPIGRSQVLAALKRRRLHVSAA
ncbi:hypothetical protein FKP32DRAFT_949916 [Trametes sanguinea]|nr:hypothetical protein FKP32DRAFT_949916 [Trametes sanguinea]